MLRQLTIVVLTVLLTAALGASLAPARAQANSTAAATAPVAVETLTGLSRVKFKALEELLREIVALTDDAEARRAKQVEFLERSATLLQDQPRLLKLWLYRARVALDLDAARVGIEAGARLLQLGAADVDDERTLGVLAQLENRGWLGEAGQRKLQAGGNTPTPAQTRTPAADEGKEKVHFSVAAPEWHPPTPRPGQDTAKVQASPTSRSPYQNTLGMKFVPVPGTEVLFSVWETRVQDYTAYAKAASGVVGSWKNTGFEQEGTHPVVNVSWEDAQKFAAWLTEKERREGKLTTQQRYRLPTDVEWSRAVGLASELGSTPQARDGGVRDVFPWGTQWPPPRGAGNYDSYSSQKLDTDSFMLTSPAGSFAANPFGLFDLGGNVSEWCEDYYDGSSGPRVMRGGAWVSYDRDFLLSSNRNFNSADYRFNNIGFRLVLVGVSVR
jgi:hypothetical protein